MSLTLLAQGALNVRIGADEVIGFESLEVILLGDERVHGSVGLEVESDASSGLAIARVGVAIPKSYDYYT